MQTFTTALDYLDESRRWFAAVKITSDARLRQEFDAIARRYYALYKQEAERSFNAVIEGYRREY